MYVDVIKDVMAYNRSSYDKLTLDNQYVLPNFSANSYYRELLNTRKLKTKIQEAIKKDQHAFLGLC